MTTFTYQGPVDSGVTLVVDGKATDVLLFRGRPVELPEDHEYVKTLLALGHLVPAQPVAEATGVSTNTASTDMASGKKGGK
jgi:hypothetical protein